MLNLYSDPELGGNAFANVRNIHAPSLTNLRGGERFNSQCSTVQRHELYLVSLSVTIDMHNHAHIAGFKADAWNIFSQYDRCMFGNHDVFLNRKRGNQPQLVRTAFKNPHSAHPRLSAAWRQQFSVDTIAGAIRRINRCGNRIGHCLGFDGLGEFLPCFDAKANPQEEYSLPAPVCMAQQITGNLELIDLQLLGIKRFHKSCFGLTKESDRKFWLAETEWIAALPDDRIIGKMMPDDAAGQPRLIGRSRNNTRPLQSAGTISRSESHPG